MIVTSDMEINALHCLLLGRPVEPGSVWASNVGCSHLAVAHALTASPKIVSTVLEPLLDGAPLPHESLKTMDSALTFAFAVEAGLLPVDDDSAIDACCGDELVALPDDKFISAVYWELLLRPPDPIGIALYLNRLTAGDTKRSILEIIDRSDERSELSYSRVLYWREGSLCSVRRRSKDLAFLNWIYRLILAREPDDAGKEHYFRELSSGAVSKLELIESLLSSAEARYVDRLSSRSERGNNAVVWSDLLNRILSSGSLRSILVRQFGLTAFQRRSGAEALKLLDQRGLEIYEQLLCELNDCSNLRA